MSGNAVLKVVNPLLALLLLSQVLTGLFSSLLSYEAFVYIHKGGGIALACAAALHMILNWSWIRATYLGGKAS